MAAARDEVEEEHQQALGRAKQRRAGAHAEKRAWRERCVRPSGARQSGALGSRAARAPIRTRAPYFAADAGVSSSAAGARRLPRGSRRAVGAAGSARVLHAGSGRLSACE